MYPYPNLKCNSKINGNNKIKIIKNKIKTSSNKIIKIYQKNNNN